MTVSELTSVSTSPTVNPIAAVETSSSVVWSEIAEIVGASLDAVKLSVVVAVVLVAEPSVASNVMTRSAVAGF